MEKLKIVKVSATNLKKDGTPILSKYGKPAWRVGIQTTQYGQTWINGFLPFNPSTWEGTEQELIITDGEFNGQPQKKFELPKKDDKSIEMLSQVLNKLGKIEAMLNVIYGDKQPDNSMKDLDTGADLSPEDIPF